MAAGSTPLENGSANGKITIRGNVMGGVNQNRACVDAQDCEELIFEENFLWARELNVQTDGVKSLAIQNNNGEAQKALLPDPEMADTPAWYRENKDRLKAVPLSSVNI